MTNYVHSAPATIQEAAPVVTPALEPAFAFLSHRRLWLLCGLICLSRLLLIPFATYLQGDDGPRYLREAINLHDSGVFSSLAGHAPPPTAHDVPLYPLLLSVLLAVFPAVSVTEHVAAAFNCVFFTAAAAALYGLAWRLSGRASIAVTAAIVFALFPETVPYSVFYEPDSLFTAMFLWAVLFIVFFLQSNAKAWLLSSAALLAAAILVKPIAEYYWPVLGLLPLFFWPGKLNLPGRAGWIVAGLCLQIAVISPWLLRNERDFGSPVLSSITGVNLFRENYRLLLEDMDPSNARAIQEKQAAAAATAAGPAWDNPLIESKRLGAIASQQIRSHWQSYLVMTLKHHPRLYLGTGSLALLRLVGDQAGVAQMEVWQSHPSLHGANQLPLSLLVLQVASWLVLALAYLAAAAGVVALLVSRQWLPLLLTLLTLGYFAAVIGPLTITRYRLPMAPFFALLAAYGIQAVFFKLRPSLRPLANWPSN